MNFIDTRSELHGSLMLLHFTNSYNRRFERALEKLNCCLRRSGKTMTILLILKRILVFPSYEDRA